MTEAIPATAAVAMVVVLGVLVATIYHYWMVRATARTTLQLSA
jgi:hypothetical protein